MHMPLQDQASGRADGYVLQGKELEFWGKSRSTKANKSSSCLSSCNKGVYYEKTKNKKTKARYRRGTNVTYILQSEVPKHLFPIFFFSGSLTLFDPKV